MPQGTCCFVHTAGEVANTTEGVAALLRRAAGSKLRSGVHLQPFDHVLAPQDASVQKVAAQLEEGTARVAVLYGALGTPCFEALHAQLLAAATEGESRHVPGPI